MPKHKGPLMKIETAFGRNLGTYPGATAVEAADAFARAHGYPSSEEAEAKRFFALERMVFTPLP
jgi:hypothetical protein